jgi:hypothetical protein
MDARRLLLLLALASPLLGGEPLLFTSGTRRVALIELYTSEGCSSCPPADRWLGSLAASPGLWTEFVPVAFHVTYWDSLGWTDRLSRREYTDRQYAYAEAWGSGRVYTPCFVRNGSEWQPAWGDGGVAAGDPGRLTIEGSGTGGWTVEYRPRGPAGAPGPAHRAHVALLGCGLHSRVTAGENRGSTLAHDFVVLAVAEESLDGRPGGPERAVVSLSGTGDPGAGRRAVAAWVTQAGSLVPLQATGGWIP